MLSNRAATICTGIILLCPLCNTCVTWLSYHVLSGTSCSTLLPIVCSDFTGSRSPTSAKKDPRIGKRKPDVDLSTISDPAERRKQRRLAKNRATAATSRWACAPNAGLLRLPFP